MQDIVSHRKFLSFYFKSNFKYYLQFSVHVEMGLMSKNLNGSQRNEFIRDICTLITTNTRYPTEPERQMSALKIVTKYPFLKDPKIGNCSTEWVRIKYIIMYIQCTKLRYNSEVLLWVTNHTGQVEKTLAWLGFELATFGLPVRCSTTWATGQVGSWSSNDDTSVVWYFETDTSFFNI